MDQNFTLTAQQANDICWNHMRSVVMSGPTTLGKLLRIANNLYSGMEAQMKTADITAAAQAFKVQQEVDAAAAALISLAANEPHRVTALVESLRDGRTDLVLDALLAYQAAGHRRPGRSRR